MIRRYMKYFFITTMVALAGIVSAQSTVKWLTWEEAESLSKTEPRKFFVDVYTDWCGWCKKMDKATFENPSVAEYLNTHFYPIKFNAEQRSEIKLNDKTYQYISNGARGYHQLALEITFGKLSYPTIVFLDENMKVIQPVPGFREAGEFQKMMKYFAEDHHKTTPWTKFAGGN
jgi:thioredoxin-related protein